MKVVSGSVGFFFQAEDGIRDIGVTGVQTCALPISSFFGSIFEKLGPTHGINQLHMPKYLDNDELNHFACVI